MKRFLFLSALTLSSFAACSAPDGGGGNGGNGSKGSGDGDIAGDGDSLNLDGISGSGGGTAVDGLPTTCADAAASASYVGCDFWPTVTANPVWQEFDFAVVVANGQTTEAKVDVSGPGGFSAQVTVAPGALQTIVLPWISELKGPEYDLPKTTGGRLTTSLSMEKGAYHLTSDLPITAWQFNPLQYRRNRADCGSRIIAAMSADATECRAASNDASLLLPSTAMTENYRVAAYSGARGSEEWGSVPGGFAITATTDGTEVTMQLPPNCDAIYNDESNGCVVAGGPIKAAVKNEILTVTMNEGDVVQVLGAYGPYPQIAHADLSGTVINANAGHPVQVISFNAIVNIPDEVGNADHAEETVLPAESIGSKYIVTPPTAFGGAPQGHIVRIYGNVDGTVLTYPEGKPPGAPDVINAGEVYELPGRTANNQCPALDSTCMLNTPFVVEGTQSFVVGSFMVGGRLQVPNYVEQYGEPGDPAFSMMVTPAQFRPEYTFLAPADFQENYADILIPEGATAVLDGKAITNVTPIGNSGWGIARELLSGDAGGIHTLTTEDERGVGLQVMGFGSATSYYYPGGLNLKAISKPPVIVR